LKNADVDDGSIIMFNFHARCVRDYRYAVNVFSRYLLLKIDNQLYGNKCSRTVYVGVILADILYRETVFDDAVMT